jgi:hypothetical protein
MLLCLLLQMKAEKQVLSRSQCNMGDMFCSMMKIFLQDMPFLQKEFPNNPVWRHPWFGEHSVALGEYSQLVLQHDAMMVGLREKLRETQNLKDALPTLERARKAAQEYIHAYGHVNPSAWEGIVPSVAASVAALHIQPYIMLTPR